VLKSVTEFVELVFVLGKLRQHIHLCVYLESVMKSRSKGFNFT